jgi:hypothetical protein
MTKEGAGMTKEGAGMAKEGAGMTKEGAGMTKEVGIPKGGGDSERRSGCRNRPGDRPYGGDDS